MARAPAVAQQVDVELQLGAVVYASGWPNPAPRTFGYHEVFHALVLAAASLHYAVIAFAVLPHAHG